MPSIPMDLVQVNYDGKGAYVALPVVSTDTDESNLQRVIESMVANGEFTKASYDIGERGGFAFKLGSIELLDCDEANDTAVVSTILEGILTARLGELAPA